VGNSLYWFSGNGGRDSQTMEVTGWGRGGVLEGISGGGGGGGTFLGGREVRAGEREGDQERSAGVSEFVFVVGSGHRGEEGVGSEHCRYCRL